MHRKTAHHSVVGHVLGGGRELGIALDHLKQKSCATNVLLNALEKNNLINLVHSVEEVLLSGDLPSRPDQTEII